MNPKVSVIIPVLNNGVQLQSTLDALSRQTYPPENIELIVVDNGSDEDITQYVTHPTVKILYETDKKSPYAARNKGMRESTGSVIALTDANKTPDERWIEEGVFALNQARADLAGGDIAFDLPDNPTAAELFDALFFNNNRTLVHNESAAVTGNLIFKKELIETVGFFPGGFRSGMDVWWSQQAVRKGHQLVFAEYARVTCLPRKFSDLMKKSRRVGKSHPFIRRQAGDSILQIAGTIIRTFAPPGLRWVSEKVPDEYGFWFRYKLWWVAWSYKIFLGIGRISGLRYLRHNHELPR